MSPTERTRASLAVRLALLAAFAGLVVFASIRLAPSISRHLSRPEDMDKFINSYGPISALVYVLLQTIQVVVFVIPGEIVQVAGGYIFGTWLGALLSVAGILLGTVIAFLAARLLGYSLVKIFLKPKRLERFEFLINNPRAEVAMFVLFLIPGIPKDSLVYISGLTPIKPLRFLLISMIARLPGLWGAAYIGANLQRKDYLPVWILSGAALVLFVIGILARDRIIDKLHRPQHRDEGAAHDNRP
jgi:uncharacterized membrane protein YdjX (TVP38/TMEM64 family)